MADQDEGEIGVSVNLDVTVPEGLVGRILETTGRALIQHRFSGGGSAAETPADD